jgi:O-antigen/teichoic acid export membrane protein
MSLMARFSKDYLNYFGSIIIPALITAITFPVLKRMLGSDDYGYYANHYNGLLIFTAISSGWVAQSILRFFPLVSDKAKLAQTSFRYVVLVQLFFFIPAVIWFGWMQHDWILCGLLCATLLVSGIQAYYMALAQSGFMSGKTIYSETIRTLVYISGAVLLLRLTPIKPMYALFVAVFFSYLFSIMYLHKRVRFMLLAKSVETSTEERSRAGMLLPFLKYGIPLSLWFGFANLLTYFDKLIIRTHLGPTIQGNYQSMFDLLSRGFTMLIAPVLITLMPLLSEAFKENRHEEIKSLLRRIVLFQVAGFVLSVICYWLFGAQLLLMLLNVPDTSEYRMMGFMILCGTFIWQIAMVTHKYYELRMKSHYLLLMVAIAFGVQLLFFQLVKQTLDPILYSMGYLCSSVCYLVMVSVRRKI